MPQDGGIVENVIRGEGSFSARGFEAAGRNEFRDGGYTNTNAATFRIASAFNEVSQNGLQQLSGFLDLVGDGQHVISLASGGSLSLLREGLGTVSGGHHFDAGYQSLRTDVMNTVGFMADRPDIYGYARSTFTLGEQTYVVYADASGLREDQFQINSDRTIDLAPDFRTGGFIIGGGGIVNNPQAFIDDLQTRADAGDAEAIRALEIIGETQGEAIIEASAYIDTYGQEAYDQHRG
ncbi:MAG: hypothetical protein GC136_08115 [Alphaproteobacteria bacterium]|nr:hypothetical protein [Alphaproteobacteria bacterium]